MFDRIARILKMFIESIVSLVEKKNPIMIANQIVAEMDSKIKAADESRFEIEARLALIKDDATRMRSEATRFENAAIQADKMGDENLAKQCAEKYAEFNDKAVDLEDQASILEDSVKELVSQIDEAHKNRLQAQSSVKLIETKHHIGNAQEAIADAITSIDINDSTSALAKLNEDADMKKHRSRAKIAVSKNRSGKDLEEKVKALSNQTAGMSALEQIRAKNNPVNALPSPVKE